MSKKKFFTNLTLCLAIALYFIKCQNLDAYDLFETNKFYLSWIGALADTPLNPGIFLKVSLITSNQIRAFEPLSGFIVLFLSKMFSGYNVIHVLNVTFLVCFFRLADSAHKWRIFLFLVCLEFCFGFYSSILMFQTHRVKVGFIVYFVLLRYGKNIWTLLIFPVLSHFSFLVLSPFTLLFSRESHFNRIFTLEKMLFPLSIVLGFYIVVNDDPIIVQVISNKMSYVESFLSIVNVAILLTLGLALRLMYKRLNGVYLLLVYIALLFIVLDMSRVLMMIYLSLYAFSWKDTKRFNPLRSINFLFFGWSLFRGLNYSLFL